jgi:hypothetical protein
VDHIYAACACAGRARLCVPSRATNATPCMRALQTPSVPTGCGRARRRTTRSDSPGPLPRPRWRRGVAWSVRCVCVRADMRVAARPERPKCGASLVHAGRVSARAHAHMSLSPNSMAAERNPAPRLWEKGRQLSANMLSAGTARANGRAGVRATRWATHFRPPQPDRWSPALGAVAVAARRQRSGSEGLRA